MKRELGRRVHLQLLKLTRLNTITAWQETFWIDLKKIRAMILREYKPGVFASMEVWFVGNKEPWILAGKQGDKEIAQAIINGIEGRPRKVWCERVGFDAPS